MARIAALLLLTCIVVTARTQNLQPGFSRDEYIALLGVTAQFSDTTSEVYIPPPAGYKRIYRSAVMGLDNRWDLWKSPQGLPIISIRGTTTKQISWMENFYAAMVPATGEMKLSSTDKFSYQLAENPKAAVHTGWLVAVGFLSKDILPKIDSLYKAGNKELYIVGHSQGGAIAYLLTAYLHGLQKQNKLPADIRFKTYCSAAPKPGNLYFASEYEALNYEGWSYNVVNSEDWVPQTPFSVQTVNDFATVNPFSDVDGFLKKYGWPKRWALRHVYNRLSKPSKKAAKNYRKYLGGYVSKTIKKALPGFEPPIYAASNDYVRTGFIISMVPGSAYFQKFPEDKAKLFRNHLPSAYLYLAQLLK